MSESITQIKNRIIDKVLFFSVIFLTIPYVASLIRIVEIGMHTLFYFHTFIYILLILLLFFRNRIGFAIKIHIYSIIFVSIGVMALLNLGFSGAFYFVFIPVFLVGVLIRRRISLYYIISILVLFILLAVGYITEVIDPMVDLDMYQRLPSSWVVFFSVAIYVAFVILLIIYDLQHYFEASVKEKDQVLRKLRRRQEQLQHIFDSSPAIMLLLDKNGRIYNVNKAGIDFAQSSFEAIIKNRAGDVFRCVNSVKSENGCGYGDHCKECVLRKTIKKILDKGIESTRVEAELELHRNGYHEKYYFHLTTKFISLPPNSKILVSLGNITDLKIAESALIESEEHLREAEAMANLGHYHIKAEKDKIEWSDELYKILNTSPKETKPTFENILNFIHPEDVDFFMQFFNDALDKDISDDFEHRLVMKNEEVRYVIHKIRTCKNINGETEYTIGAILDITRLKEVEFELIQHQLDLEVIVEDRTKDLYAVNEELKAANDELYNKNEMIIEQKEKLEKALLRLREAQNHLIHAEKMASLGILTSGVAHEINNPLNFIQGGATGLEDYFIQTNQNQSPKVKLFMEGILEGIERITNIVKSLNQFGKESQLMTENCDLHSIIENCLTMLNNEIRGRIEVIRDFSKEPFSLLANSSKLHQVFLNLISNAVQSIQDAGTITISTKLKKENILIEIKDTGCGIKDEDLLHIMDPFYTTKDPGTGIGMGLSITYKLIQDHKGDLNFISKPGKGTIARVKLRLKP